MSGELDFEYVSGEKELDTSAKRWNRIQILSIEDCMRRSRMKTDNLTGMTGGWCKKMTATETTARPFVFKFPEIRLKMAQWN